MDGPYQVALAAATHRNPIASRQKRVLATRRRGDPVPCHPVCYGGRRRGPGSRRLSSEPVAPANWQIEVAATRSRARPFARIRAHCSKPKHIRSKPKLIRFSACTRA
jgi:hypothetical protein